MSTELKLVVDKDKIKKAVQTGLPLTVTTYSLPYEIEIYIEQILTEFLAQIAHENLKDYIIYCVKELAGNAKRANTKRVYFMERGLRLDNQEEYKFGMVDFKKTTLNNIDHYLQLQREKGLYIKLILQIKDNTISIEVRNNALATNQELVRIRDKITRARQFCSLEDAATSVLDDTEGAGLGLVILVLMLKKIGLDETCFNVLETENETVAKIKIPLDQARVETLSALSSAVVENVNSLPQFPENISQLQNKLSDPNFEISEVARLISTDPALTADLLKNVNSARYMLSKKIDSISEAVKLVGIKGIKNLLYSYGTLKILGDDTREKKILWEHSHRTAFYAHYLIKDFCKDRNLPDEVYIGGILHDMGKIIFSSVHPQLLGIITKLSTEKKHPPSLFEDLAAGMNHAEIGALIAEKWNFPDDLVSVIRFHHDPMKAPENVRDLTCAVYLANMFCGMEDGVVTFDQLDHAVLEKIGIATKDKAETLMQQLDQMFMERV